jgi:hypothetical protein
LPAWGLSRDVLLCLLSAPLPPLQGTLRLHPERRVSLRVLCWWIEHSGLLKYADPQLGEVVKVFNNSSRWVRVSREEVAVMEDMQTVASLIRQRDHPHSGLPLDSVMTPRHMAAKSKLPLKKPAPSSIPSNPKVAFKCTSTAVFNNSVADLAFIESILFGLDRKMEEWEKQQLPVDEGYVRRNYQRAAERLQKMLRRVSG